ncbi:MULTISPECIES: preprotein translocase subunit YajC [unclassified Sedimentibacter]|uniref:preprotein translocase subunit YajC n=1 Tax=unclassified Sedimentibacter TaxID=2649220 RepID=UPI0027DF89C5|nr:preprotein translocase subunit YajC [Sedimentibacter sp. MB35-C1]WMJ75809.1 preprotein translocase subunit YajC [Sedimentibacter sp. MB35-C1]
MEQYSGILMMVVLFALMYFMMIRPQKKKDKEIKAMRDSLATGDEVITIGGIHGKVVKVNDEIVVLEMPHAKQRIEFSKWAIGNVVKKGKEKAAAVEEVETETKSTDEDDNK